MAYPADLRGVSGLTVSERTLLPEFSVGTFQYTATVPGDMSSIAVSAATDYPGSKIEGAGEQGLAEGENTITVTVTSEDGAATNAYTVTVTR